MKLLIASDIHGSAKFLRQLLTAFEREKCNKLVLLGDILYHGPRNPLPDEYSPKTVSELLGEIKEKIVCVQGNCDSEVDQMVLPFPIMNHYGLICVDGLNLYISHGHRDIPPLSKGDIYLTGHTHIPKNQFENGVLFLNPGSISLPKENSHRGYILYENRAFTFKTLSGEQLEKVEL